MNLNLENVATLDDETLAEAHGILCAEVNRRAANNLTQSFFALACPIAWFALTRSGHETRTINDVATLEFGTQEYDNGYFYSVSADATFADGSTAVVDLEALGTWLTDYAASVGTLGCYSTLTADFANHTLTAR